MKTGYRRKVAFSVPLNSYDRVVEVFNKNNIELYSLFPKVNKSQSVQQSPLRLKAAAPHSGGEVEARNNSSNEEQIHNPALATLAKQYTRNLPNKLFFDSNALDESIALLRDIQPDFILYGSDIFIETTDILANAICSKFSNPLSSSKCRENKHRMNTVLAAKGFRVPKEIVVNSLDDFLPYNLAYPVIIKPCEDSGAGFGVRQCQERQEVIHYLSEHSYQCVIQEVIWDKRDLVLQISYSVDGFVLNGEFTFISLQRFYKKKINNTFECFYVEQLDSTSEFSKNIFSETGKMLKALELNNGFIHPELIQYNEALVLIDLNPRIGGGGGIIDKMIELSFGIGVVQYFINKVYNNLYTEPVLKTHSRLIFFYDLSHKKFKQVQSLLSFKENVFNDIFNCNMVLLGNDNLSQLNKDFNHCLCLTAMG